MDKTAEEVMPLIEEAFRAADEFKSFTSETRNLNAGPFSGKVIIYWLVTQDESRILQTKHILWDGTRIWNGQLTGHEEKDLATVEAILRSKAEEMPILPVQ